ncbi:MAG: response regulator transcription factor [Lachnospiraceae bacterium]|nr:response regulator transcription factor [Lachnospiraceae bacterium]
MIYCVEDDDSIRELMVYTLQASGFEACGFEAASVFWDTMRERKPELVILDIMLPGEDGISILKKLRASPVTEEIPVIMATAKDSEYDTVIGLDSGADDYLSKPFGMMEMVSRIKAVLRRSTPQKREKRIQCGSIVIDEGKHTVTVNDNHISLTLKEYELLKLLAENSGQVFTRDILLSSVWGADFVGETRTVDVHIGTLRTKLDECGEMIKTVRGVGYKMEG